MLTLQRRSIELWGRGLQSQRILSFPRCFLLIIYCCRNEALFLIYLASGAVVGEESIQSPDEREPELQAIHGRRRVSPWCVRLLHPHRKLPRVCFDTIHLIHTCLRREHRAFFEGRRSICTSRKGFW